MASKPSQCDLLDELYVETGLAIVGTEFLPGPPPDPADPVYRVSAAKIDNAYAGDIVFSRQIFASP